MPEDLSQLVGVSVVSACVHVPMISLSDMNLCHRLITNARDLRRFVVGQALQRPTTGVDVQDTGRVKYIGLVWVDPYHGEIN